MTPLYLWWVKKRFASNRIHVYEALINSLVSVGSKRQELQSETFKRWADRDSRRGKAIAFAFRSIQKRLEAGKPLSDALGPFIPVEEMLTIQAGERGSTSGDKDKKKPKVAIALESARMQKMAADEMKSAARGALTEPVSQIATFFLTSVLYGFFVWPEMMRSFPEKYWPAWAMPMIDIQLFAANNWFFFGGVFLLIYAYYWSLPNWTGRYRKIFDKFPPYSVYRDRMASALLGVLGGLLHGGLTIEEALRRVEAKAKPYLKWHVRQMIRLLPASGKDPMKALSTGLFSQDILDRIEDASASREFDETLAHMGHEALSSVVKLVQRTTKAAAVGISAMVAVLFLYMTMVQIFGIQDATDKYIASQSGGHSNMAK